MGGTVTIVKAGCQAPGRGLESPVELTPEGGEKRVPGESEKWHTHLPLPHFDSIAWLEPHGLLSVDRQNEILGRLDLLDRDPLRGRENQGAYRERVWANRSDEDAVDTGLDDRSTRGH